MKTKHAPWKCLQRLAKRNVDTRYSVRVTDRAGCSVTHPCRDWAHVLVTARNLARDYPAPALVDAHDTYRADLRGDGQYWTGLSDDEQEQVDDAVAAGRELAGRKVAT